MPSKRHYFFYVSASLFCLTSQWLCHAVTEGAQPARRRSYAPESGKATRKASAPHESSTPQRSKIDSTRGLINPGRDVANTEITGSEFEKAHQKEWDADRLFYKQRSAPDKQLDRKKFKNQAISLVKRPAQNKLTTLLDNPTLRSNATDQNILTNFQKKEPDAARINRALNTQSLNLTVNVAKLDLCVLVCLAHGSCLGAIFDVRKSICKLRSRHGDLADQQVPSTGVVIHNYDNDDVKFFTVNHKMLTNIIGKCADQPCRNGTFCSHLSDASYACLPLAQFIHRIRKRDLRHQEGEKDEDEEEEEAEETKTDVGRRLVRKKRSLTEVKTDAKHKNSTHKQPIDCGLPPTFPKVLSLFTKTTIGATTTYYCENGVHTENAHTVIICQPNGEWSKSNFQCAHTIPCPKPKQIPGTIMHHFEQNGTKVVKYLCKNNPYLSNQTICNRRNGTWSRVEMNCNSHTDGAKPLALENKLDHFINWKPPGNEQSTSRYLTHDGKTSKQNEIESSPDANKLRRAAFETVSNETSDRNNTIDQNFEQVRNFTTSTIPLSNETLDRNNTMGQDLEPTEGFYNSTTPLPNGNFTTSIIPSSNETLDRNNTMGQDLEPTEGFYNSTTPLPNGNFTTAIIPSSNETLDRNKNLQPMEGFYNSTTPLPNGTSDRNNITDQDLGPGEGFNTSTMSMSNGTSNGSSTTYQSLDQVESVTTSTTALSNGISNNNTTDYDLGPSDDLYTTVAPKSTPETHYTTQNSDASDGDVTVTFWETAPPEIEKILLPLGIMSDNVNTMAGIPGFFCWYPSPVAFAIGFYSSRSVGSKIVYQCRRYVFSTPVPYCPIVTCLIHGFWSELSISCSDLDCINHPNQYVGKRMCSSSGFQCRNWDEAITDPYQRSIVSFPDDNITMAKNYCRDPLRSGFLWCFTKNPSVVWDFCNVPTCP